MYVTLKYGSGRIFYVRDQDVYIIGNIYGWIKAARSHKFDSIIYEQYETFEDVLEVILDRDYVLHALKAGEFRCTT